MWEYQGSTKGPRQGLVKADPRGLGAWLSKHLNTSLQEIGSDSVCYHGVLLTTRETVQRRPREFYAKLREKLDDRLSESADYVERAAHFIFGRQAPILPVYAPKAFC